MRLVVLPVIPGILVTSRAFPSENIAQLATVSAQGQLPEAVIDGVKQPDGDGEWKSQSTNAWYGMIDYPTLTLTWDTPLLINKVVLYDRPVESEHAAA